MMPITGIESLVRFVSHLCFVYLAFWSIQSLDYQKWFKKNHVSQVRLFLAILSIALGFMASSMVLECFTLLSNYVYTLRH